MNILIFSEDFPPHDGGIAQWAIGIATSLHKLGHTPFVYSRYRPDLKQTPYEPISFGHFPVVKRHWKKWRTFYWAETLRKHLRKTEAPEMIIATTWNVARGLVPLCRKRNIKLITVVHGFEVTRTMAHLKKLWLTRTLQASTMVVAVSHFTKARVLQRLKNVDTPIVVLPNGVDPARFSSNLSINFLKDRHRLKDEKIILTLSRILPRKGHSQVIRALPELLVSFPKLKYIIAGKWKEPFCHELMTLAEKLKVHKHLLFTGYIAPKEIAAYYNLCDVYVMASRELKHKGDIEGFGITFLESNACGKPVIGGNSGGTTDAIIDGKTGFLVDPHSVDEIREKIKMILDDEALARELGNNGRERVASLYNWDLIANRLLKAFHESGHH